METNKLKLLSIAICCLSTALWAEIQGAEEQRDEPAGIINSFAGEIAPNGWLLCDGKKCFSRDYPKLYEVIKTKYVPANEKLDFLEFNENNDNKKFCVPDLRGRVIVGVDSGAGRVTSNNTIGANGGEENVTLTINQMPKHTHDIMTGGTYACAESVMRTNNAMLLSTPVQSAGGDQPHNNMQPYTCLNYIINTGNMYDRRENALINIGIVEQLQRQVSELNLTLANLPVIPIGAIMEYSGTISIPANFLECNGAAISRVTYARLFADIGVTYGAGDNINTFNLPDRRGRVAVGIDSNNNTGGLITNATAPNIALGQTFGVQTHQLTIGELPSHSHGISASSSLHGGNYTSANSCGALAPQVTGSTGGDQPHNNMQPSIFMKYYIRAK